MELCLSALIEIVHCAPACAPSAHARALHMAGPQGGAGSKTPPRADDLLRSTRHPQNDRGFDVCHDARSLARMGIRPPEKNYRCAGKRLSDRAGKETGPITPRPPRQLRPVRLLPVIGRAGAVIPAVRWHGGTTIIPPQLVIPQRSRRQMHSWT